MREHILVRKDKVTRYLPYPCETNALDRLFGWYSPGRYAISLAEFAGSLRQYAIIGVWTWSLDLDLDLEYEIRLYSRNSK